MTKFIWAWALIWWMPGQQPLLTPYYLTEEECLAAIDQVVGDHPPLTLCNLSDGAWSAWPADLCVVASCSPMLRPETARKKLKEAPGE